MEVPNTETEEEEISFVPNVPNSFFDDWETGGDEEVDDDVTPDWSFEVFPPEQDSLEYWSHVSEGDEMELVFFRDDFNEVKKGPVKDQSLNAARASMNTTNQPPGIFMQALEPNLEGYDEGLDDK